MKGQEGIWKLARQLVSQDSG